MDDRDQEIAWLKAQPEARRAGGAGGVLKALGLMILVAVAVFGCMAVVGSMLPPGQRFEDACRAEVRPEAVEACMAGLDRTYRGPDRAQNYRNAAAQWADDNDAKRPRYEPEWPDVSSPA